MDWLIGLGLRAGFGLLRLMGPRFGPAFGAFLARNLGPITPAHRIARDNIAAAFPEKSVAERAAILTEAWDNLGRTACEYVHMDRIWDFDPENPKPDGLISASAETGAIYERLRDDGKPAIVFSAHLANWELPAISAAKHGLPSAVLYRTPNNPHIARDVVALRTAHRLPRHGHAFCSKEHALPLKPPQQHTIHPRFLDHRPDGTTFDGDLERHPSQLASCCVHGYGASMHRVSLDSSRHGASHLSEGHSAQRARPRSHNQRAWQSAGRSRGCWWRSNC
jgi:hypothetical protein